jgi:hypothetical protein
MGLTALEAAAAVPVLLGPVQVIQVEETEVLVHLLALLVPLRFMQAAEAGLVIQDF